MDEETKEKLRQIRAGLDPMSLADEVERRLGEIFEIVERIEEERWEEMERAGEGPARAETPVKAASTKHKTINLRVS